MHWFGNIGPRLPIDVGSETGICEPLHQQLRSLAEELAEIQAEIDGLDWSDPYTALREAAVLNSQARALRRQLAAVEAQQITNGCSPH